MNTWAENFYEIQEALEANTDLQERVLHLVDSEPIHGKSTEGGDRNEALREILHRFFEGDFDLEEAVGAVSSNLPRSESPHAHSNRVFASGWEERLVRTQASRFYNQAVLQLLNERGDETCYIPHSPREDSDSDCTLQLAGGEADVVVLLNRLERAHGQGEWHDEVMVPDHPHCTHTVTPSE